MSAVRAVLPQIKDACPLPIRCRTGNHKTRSRRICGMCSTAITVLKLLGIDVAARCRAALPLRARVTPMPDTAPGEIKTPSSSATQQNSKFKILQLMDVCVLFYYFQAVFYSHKSNVTCLMHINKLNHNGLEYHDSGVYLRYLAEKLFLHLKILR